ncbi:MAG: hypothetical protein KDA74_10905, partial [Planctomycetaceae bacterium]|nr:hypothetical protein [Planctomycetaceae bacterium]
EICRFFKKNKRFQNQSGTPGLQEALNEQAGESDAAWADEFCSHIYTTALNNIHPLFDDQTWKAFELTWIKDIGAQQAAEKLSTEITWIYKAKFLVQKKLKEEIQRLSFDSVVFQK